MFRSQSFRGAALWYSRKRVYKSRILKSDRGLSCIPSIRCVGPRRHDQSIPVHGWRLTALCPELIRIVFWRGASRPGKLVGLPRSNTLRDPEWCPASLSLWWSLPVDESLFGGPDTGCRRVATVRQVLLPIPRRLSFSRIFMFFLRWFLRALPNMVESHWIWSLSSIPVFLRMQMRWLDYCTETRFGYASIYKCSSAFSSLSLSRTRAWTETPLRSVTCTSRKVRDKFRAGEGRERQVEERHHGHDRFVHSPVCLRRGF